MQEARYYLKQDGQSVQCVLCPHNCRIKDGDCGKCGVRENRGGTLYSLVFEKAIASNVDPIEKKPLFHVYPGSKSFSIATVGCNLECHFCQNCDISQMPKSGKSYISGVTMTSDQVVEMAVKEQCKTIACTYTEPTIFFEYAYDIAKKGFDKGVKTVFISNGYINPAPLKEIAPFLLAANIDLKGWDKNFYKSIVGGDLKHVLATLELLKELNIWLEVTTLVVPTWVDNEPTLKEIARFIKNHLGPETPWHISRFHPQYLCNELPMTPLNILKRAREIGLEAGLRYVYSGNVPGDMGENTWCYSCGTLLIERWGFTIIQNRIVNNTCPHCGTHIDGIGISGLKK